MTSRLVPIFLVTCWLAASIVSASAETYYVRSDGNDQGDGKTPQTAFKTLLRAAHVLDHGDGVILRRASIAARCCWRSDSAPMGPRC